MLASLAISGFTVNFVFASFTGVLLPLFISLPVSVISAVFLTRILAEFLAKVLPKNETSAVSVNSFSGGIAEITIGKAKVGSPAEACYIDSFKQKHYLMVEPVNDHDCFTKGEQVVLIENANNCWKASPLNL